MFTFGVGVIAVSAAVAVTAVAVNDVYTGNVSSMGTYFKAAQAGAVVGMIGAAAGAIGGMVVGALKLGAVGTAVVSGVAGGLSAGASTLTTDAIMNGGPLALSPFGQMVSGKPMFSDGIFDKAWDNTVIFGAGGALGSYGMGMADSPVLKLLIGLASPVPFAMMGSALDDEGVSEFLPSGGGLSFDDGFGGGMGLNMLLFSGGVQLFENSPALAGAGAAGGTYGGTTAVLGGNAGAAAGSPAAAVNPAAAAGQMALYNQLAGGLAAMETLLGHLNKEEAARQQKVLEQARERFQELAEAEEKYISANIKSRAEALAAVEAMMRELDLTQSQYEAIRDALIAQNVISAAAGQAYAGTWEDLLYGDLAEYGVGYAPVLGNIYWAMSKEQRAALRARRKELMAEINSMKNPPPDKKPDKEQKPLKKPSREKFDKYLDELEKKTGYKFTEEQRQKLYDALDNEDFYELTPEQNKAWRNDFDNKKDRLIQEWEKHTGQKWPTYKKWVMTDNGPVLKTYKYDAHHIFENHFTGAAEWWNIIPAHPDTHTGIGGIHWGDSLADNLFNDN